MLDWKVTSTVYLLHQKKEEQIVFIAILFNKQVTTLKKNTLITSALAVNMGSKKDL